MLVSIILCLFSSLEEPRTTHGVYVSTKRPCKGWVGYRTYFYKEKEMIQIAPSAIKVRDWKKLCFGIPKDGVF